MLAPRSFARWLRRLVPSAGVVTLGAVAVCPVHLSCVSCMHELALVVPAPSPDAMSSKCAACPASVAGVELQDCTAVPSGLRCFYVGGYSDPTENLPELDEAECSSICRDGADVLGCVRAEQGPVCVTRGGCVGGRRHGAMPSFAVEGHGLARYFGEMAFLEACSVEAFERLATDLEDAAAPAWLVRACRAAARDEARHAKVVLGIARACGWQGTVPQERPHPPASRSLERLAIENAVEGDRETFGAVAVAALARAIPGPVGRALRAVARDEARHAVLSQTIHAWLDRVLDDEARRRVARSRREAFERFCMEESDEGLRAVGVHGAAQRAIKASLRDALLPSPALEIA